jgi:hypothetical protein
MAGSKAGSKLMGLSLGRAGESASGNHGAPGAAGSAPKSAPKMSFNDAGAKRNGSTKYPSYPGEKTAHAEYKGGCGTGQHGGSQGC